MTSVMDLESFGVPSTLNTGMGLDSFQVVRRCVQTYSRSMKFPVAPESTRELTDLTSAVFMVSMLTFSFKDLGSFSAEATSFSGRARSQRGQNCHASSNFSTSLVGSTGSSILGMLSTGKIENRLCADGKGVLFTHRPWENPLPQVLPGSEQLAPVRLPRPVGPACFLAAPVTHLLRGSAHQNDRGIPCSCVRFFRIGNRTRRGVASFLPGQSPSGRDSQDSGPGVCLAESE